MVVVADYSFLAYSHKVMQCNNYFEDINHVLCYLTHTAMFCQQTGYKLMSRDHKA